jgi:hypothetical protein
MLIHCDIIYVVYNTHTILPGRVAILLYWLNRHVAKPEQSLRIESNPPDFTATNHSTNRGSRTHIASPSNLHARPDDPGVAGGLTEAVILQQDSPREHVNKIHLLARRA